MALISWRFYLIALIAAFAYKYYVYFSFSPESETPPVDLATSGSAEAEQDSYAVLFLSSLHPSTWWFKSNDSTKLFPEAESMRHQKKSSDSLLWRLLTSQFLFLKRGSFYWMLFYLLVVFLVIHYLLNPLSCLILELLKSLISKILTLALRKMFPNDLPAWLQPLLHLTSSVAHIRTALDGFKWQDQIVVITGGASGLGNRLSKVCIELGATVIILDIKSVDPVGLEASSPGRLFSYPCQVGDRQQVYEVAQFILQEIGVPTVIVNNAGIHYPRFLLQASDDSIEQVFQVNALSHFWMIKAFLPSMIARKRGHIMTVSSCLGLGAVAKLSDYCATKFAVNGLHESLRQELKLLALDKHIKTTIICPYLFKHGMFQKVKVSFPCLTPTLDMSKIVNQMVMSIKSCEPREEIWLPAFVYVVPLMRMLPTRLYDWIHKVFGSNEALLSSDELDSLANGSLAASMASKATFTASTTRSRGDSFSWLSLSPPLH